MNFLFWIAATVALIFTPAAIILYTKIERYRKRIKQLELLNATLAAEANQHKDVTEELKQLRDKAVELKEEALKVRLEADKKLELMQQKLHESEKRMLDWETQRSEAVKAAKASILEAGVQLSSKLLEDHKREAESSKKEQEAIARKTTEELFEKMTLVSNKVASLNDQNSETKERMATVWRALASPAGAGFIAEVGLENSLKNLGLEPGRDFVMQYAISADETNLRPDAVIFLPQEMVMVIDSKASKFLLEIAEVENTETENEVLVKLKKTMNDHLKALISKDYRSAVMSLYKESGRADKARNILNVMYLPSENAITQIKRADPEFTYKCEKVDIILAGPASISGLLSLARFNIGMMRQAENQDAIVLNMQELLDYMVVVLGYADKVGRGLKTANEYFDQFARSINKRMIPKMRQLSSLGVKPNKNKDIPAKITSYTISTSDDMLTIEGDIEVVE